MAKRRKRSATASDSKPSSAPSLRPRPRILTTPVFGQPQPTPDPSTFRIRHPSAKRERFAGALLFAHHHPPYAIGGQHSSSLAMRRQMDAVCAHVGLWPHAVLAGHVHSYQRFTRHRPDGGDIPYLICGNGGHNVQKLRSEGGAPIRAPQTLQGQSADDDAVTFENYDDGGYGYLRVIVNTRQLRIEYHPARDGAGAKTPNDSVTIDLATRRQTTYVANDLGLPALGEAVRAQVAAQPAPRPVGSRRRRRP